MSSFFQSFNRFLIANFGQVISRIIFFTRFSFLRFFCLKEDSRVSDFLSDIDDKFQYKTLASIKSVISNLNKRDIIVEILPSTAMLSVFIAQLSKSSENRFVVVFPFNSYSDDRNKEFSFQEWHQIIIRKNVIPYIELKNDFDFLSSQIDSVKLIVVYKSRIHKTTELLIGLYKSTSICKNVKVLEIDDLSVDGYKAQFFSISAFINI